MRKSYLNRIKANISIYARKYSSSLLEGSYRSIYKGKSLNFDDLREYVVGDNVRDIDWKASARSRKLLVKQYIAEKQHNVMILLDTDKKMLAHSLDGDVKIPTAIAKDSGIRTNHISKVLSELKAHELVECINPEVRKGRLYRLTDKGEKITKNHLTGD